MVKLLYICDLDSLSIESITKVLKNINETISEIVLHYSYQIPKNTSNIIETHDKIKAEATQKLLDFSEEISEIIKINTSFKLTLGTNNNTLKRVLLNSDFKYVTFNTKIDKNIKLEFKNINFITLDKFKSA